MLTTFINFVLDDYLSGLPTELVYFIVQWLNFLERKALMQSCTRFANMKDLILPLMPGGLTSVVSEYDLVLLQLQSHFQRSLCQLPPILPSIRKVIPIMYENMRLVNAFKHLVLCGIDGCKMCRSTEQWSKVLPLKIYNEYLGVIRQQHAARNVTTGDLGNFIQMHSDHRHLD